MGTRVSKEELAQGRDDELWQVMVGPTGCLMTREELTAALARDDVHRSTLVRSPGAIRWTTARQGLGLPRTEQDRSLDKELPNLPPPLEVQTRKRRETRRWRPTKGTLFGLGVLVFVSGAVLATSTASLTRAFDKPKAQQAVAVSPVASVAAPITPTPHATASAASAAPVIVSAVPPPPPRTESTSARAALLKPPPMAAPSKPREERAPHAPSATPTADRKHAPIRAAAIKPAAPSGAHRPPRKATFAKHAPRTKPAPSRKAKRR